MTGPRGMPVVQIIKLITTLKRRLVRVYVIDAGEDTGVLTPQVQRSGGNLMVQGGRRARE